MPYSNESIEVKTKNGKFFDFASKSIVPIIVDYSLLDNEIIISSSADSISLDGLKIKKKICTLSDLQKNIDEFITAEQTIISRNCECYAGLELGNGFASSANMVPLSFHIDIRPEDRKLIIEQVIFDVLSDKYLEESPQMTLRQYSLSHRGYNADEVTDDALKADAVRKSVKGAMQKQVNMMNNAKSRADMEKFGVNPDKYFTCLSELSPIFEKCKKKEVIEKPKVVWDYIYYNGNKK